MIPVEHGVFDQVRVNRALTEYAMGYAGCHTMTRVEWLAWRREQKSWRNRWRRWRCRRDED
jgi:membrane protein YqaA with SNARE-associated domain